MRRRLDSADSGLSSAMLFSLATAVKIDAEVERTIDWRPTGDCVGYERRLCDAVYTRRAGDSG